MSYNGFEPYEYDVALSFAGENRDYVEKVANYLKSNGISVFYDMYEQSNLWGKDLYTHLDKIYREKALFCVAFISEHYKNKLWTKHELHSAFARAFASNTEYILPAKFDDTEIPGIQLTTGYIDLRYLEPIEFAKLISEKINSYLQNHKAYLIGDGIELELLFEDNTFIIGRDERFNRGIFTCTSISKRHAIIFLVKNAYYIIDLDSINGTYINNERIHKDKRLLRDGDEIVFGKMKFTFSIMQ